MAKIDISKIDGYADMTPEQKIAALEAFETEDPDYSGYVKKDMCRLTIEGRLLSLSQVVKTLCGLSLVLVSIIMALPVRPLTLMVRNWE